MMWMMTMEWHDPLMLVKCTFYVNNLGILPHHVVEYPEGISTRLLIIAVNNNVIEGMR
jgi:hypothetical protein